jgi:hypothetical protein
MKNMRKTYFSPKIEFSIFLSRNPQHCEVMSCNLHAGRVSFLPKFSWRAGRLHQFQPDECDTTPEWIKRERFRGLRFRETRITGQTRDRSSIVVVILGCDGRGFGEQFEQDAGIHAGIARIDRPAYML